MKIGKNFVTGKDTILTSWKSDDDPREGQFSLLVDPRGFPQLVVRDGGVNHYRLGSWNGNQQSPTITYHFVFNKNEAYFKFETTGASAIARYTIYPSGLLQRNSWNDQTNTWMVLSTGQVDQCENYALCGAYGTCYIQNSPLCSCLDGFRPKSPEDWNLTKWSAGCVRKTPLSCNNCSDGEGFVMYSGIKIPDTRQSWYNATMELKECERNCRDNCSCTAYANMDVRNGGNGCILWFGDLVDIRQYNDNNGQDIYIRLAASEMDNKLGQGGYGPVYKGILKNGRTIAVKRLSKRSRQGTHEFKNEVVCIAKLQHRNLVKLLGCCIQSDERVLIYEYMPNKSLNFFIFDKRQSVLLDWPKRLHIINGIARGLLYLHQDSRLRIIHRDMKASNVLLDDEMNPKISDFGMARSFAGDESSANTKRIVGTYGYMSPEYAIDGLFSIKSDVFSFGVLVLEIISGKKNRGFSHTDHKLNLLGHAWMLHKEGRSHELADECIKDTCSNLAEVERAVHIGLMCVQQSPEDRPNMSSLVVMLSSEIELAQPKEPGFFTERDILEATSSMSKHEYSSSNKLSETLIDAR
ncbi:G-type lectin S-receptor-like serine/threonine-protein kinase At4g27290 [Linum grandiflorum]